jgi:carboxypeptidase family protein
MTHPGSRGVMRRIWTLGAIAMTISAFPATGARAGAAGLPAWDRVPAASPGTAAALHGVAAIGPGDVWAVGSGAGRTLTEHSDGGGFTVVPSPNAPGRTNVLENVDGVASDDVWAVGHATVNDFFGSRSLTLHWDGSGWSRVRSPNKGTEEDRNDLSDVAAISPTDAWAVGRFWTLSGSSRALTLHWDGSRWQAVRNPCGYSLDGVFALSSLNVWAVGSQSSCRWDGRRWTAHPVATAPNGTGVQLLAVAGSGGNDLWAVGSVPYSCGEGQICPGGAIEHWNGSNWSFVLGAAGQALYGVTAVSATNVYAVGVGVGEIIVHFDGTGWSEVPEPTPWIPGRLEDVDASSATDLWAAGSRYASGLRTLAEHAPSATSGAVVGDTNVSGATVSWFGPESGSVETDVYGEYQVGGLDAGTYTFTATSPGCTPDSGQVDVVAGTTITRDFHLGC